MPLTFRLHLESIWQADASAHEILSWGTGLADSGSWAEAVAALKRMRRLENRTGLSDSFGRITVACCRKRNGSRRQSRSRDNSMQPNNPCKRIGPQRRM